MKQKKVGPREGRGGGGGIKGLQSSRRHQRE